MSASPRPALGLLPLDDRPVNTTRAAQVAAALGYDLLIPRRELLGHRDHPGDRDALATWLLDHAAAVQGWALSLDMLCYGGLVASRDDAEPAEACAARLEVLARLRIAAPEAPVVGFMAIRRHAGTVLAREDLLAWERAQAEASARDARQRNHAVNLAAVDRLGRGDLDWLSLLQEDVGEDLDAVGLEHRALRARLGAVGAQDRAWITAGADEGAATALARLDARLDTRPDARRRGAPTRVAARFSSIGGLARVAPYEDRAVGLSVDGQLLCAGLVPTREPAEADALLRVWAPDREGRDLFLDGPWSEDDEDPEVRSEREAFVDGLAEDLAGARPVVLADLGYANGADPQLMRALARRGLLPRLAGFAAWNTAGNALGSAAAQARAAARGADLAALARLRDHHLLDDWGYQAVLRPRVRRWVELERQGDPWNLEGYDRARAESFLDTHLGRWFTETLEPALQEEERPPAPPPPTRVLAPVYLPWCRVFEAEVEVEAAPGPTQDGGDGP